MKKFFCSLAVLAISAVAFAQTASLPMILDIASIENDGQTILEVINVPENGQNHYYLNVGTLGFGDKNVQFHFDPIHCLFIPLGDTLEESLNTLNQFKDLAKAPKGTSQEISGVLDVYPTSRLETVNVSAYKLIFIRKLMFSVDRDGYMRGTYVTRSNIRSIITSVKLYKAIHPKEL